MAIDREDFNRLEDRIADGFKQINERLDTLNGRTRKNESDIAVLNERSGGTWFGAVAGGFAGGFTAVGAWALEKLWK